MPQLIPIQIDFRDVNAQRKKNLAPTKKRTSFGVDVQTKFGPAQVAPTEEPDYFDLAVTRRPFGVPQMPGRALGSGPFGQPTVEERETQSPFWTAERQRPGTLAHAMAQVDKEFGFAPEDPRRADLKAQLEEFLASSEIGQRARFEKRSLLDAFKEVRGLEYQEQVASAPTETLFPGFSKSPAGQVATAVADYPYRLIGGVGRFPVMLQEAAAGVYAGDKTAAETGAEFAQIFNPAEKGINLHERVSRGLDITTIGLSVGHGVRQRLQAKKQSQLTQAADALAGGATLEELQGPPVAEPKPVANRLRGKKLQEVPDASQVTQAAEVYGDVQPQPVQGEGQMPKPKGRQGVRPKAQAEEVATVKATPKA